jgi:hypothetical protein
MATRQLTELEALTLLGVEELTEWKLEPYGRVLWSWLADQYPDSYSRAGVYLCLSRLTKLGMLKVTDGPPKKEPGGRGRLLYRLTPKGDRALNHHRDMMSGLWT